MGQQSTNCLRALKVVAESGESFADASSLMFHVCDLLSIKCRAQVLCGSLIASASSSMDKAFVSYTESKFDLHSISISTDMKALLNYTEGLNYPNFK